MAEELRHVRTALLEHGFLYLRLSTALSPDLCADAFLLSRRLFALPSQVKQSFAYDPVRNAGYVSLLQESLGGMHVPDAKPDFKEAWNFENVFHQGEETAQRHRACLPHDDSLLENATLANATVLDLQAQCRAAGLEVMRAIGLALGLTDDYFASSHNQHDNTGTTLRFLHYPATPPDASASMRNDLPGAGEHTDYGSVTLLLLEEGDEGSLEVRTRAGDWQRVPYQSDTLLVNVGDLLQQWTNYTATSTPHRVSSVRGKRDRYSIAYFFHPNDHTLIEPIPQFGSGHSSSSSSSSSFLHPSTDSRLTAIQYLRSRLNATY